MRIKIKARRFKLILASLLKGPRWTVCQLCKKRTFYYKEGALLRENKRCIRCGSIPRWRAMFDALETIAPNWQQLAIHESAPFGALSEKLAQKCRNYTPTHYFPDVEPGSMERGIRNENLEKQTFPDEQFDIVITQDVLEHVADPQSVFKEIARTLKPGGKHFFSIPRDPSKPTEPRVKFRGDEIVHLKPPEYHGNPYDPAGLLVITDWGDDICELILQWAGTKTEMSPFSDDHDVTETRPAVEVFISHKD